MADSQVYYSRLFVAVQLPFDTVIGILFFSNIPRAIMRLKEAISCFAHSLSNKR